MKREREIAIDYFLNLIHNKNKEELQYPEEERFYYEFSIDKELLDFNIDQLAFNTSEHLELLVLENIESMEVSVIEDEDDFASMIHLKIKLK